MANGATFRQLMFSFRVAENTISLFVLKVLEALTETLKDEVMPSLVEPEQWKEVSDKFQARWNFPLACGALDGKHIPVKAPPKSSFLYHNYKGFLPHNALQCKARSCYHMSSVCLSVCPSVCPSVTLVDHWIMTT